MSTDYRMERMPLEALERVFPKMKDDFPRGELKPKAFLRRQMKAGVETGWLLTADGQEAGYAFMVADPSVAVALLDYLAVYRRGQGDGSAFLSLLQQEYSQGMIVEAEDEVADDPDTENEVRRKRMRFYRRAGFEPCPFDHKIFGVSYLVHAWFPQTASAACDEQAHIAQVESAIKELYRIQFSRTLRRAQEGETFPRGGKAR